MTTAAVENRVTLNDVSWEFYQAMLREVGDRHIRLTFDQGRLEIMSPSGFHERVKKVIARLIEAYCEEMDILLEGYGSTTFAREDLQKGLEPDECFYVANAPAVLDKGNLDLAIEIDLSHPGASRQPIYAAMGVPEIWRYDGRRIICLHRVVEEATGPRYVPADSSRSFPKLSLPEFSRLVDIGLTRGQGAAVKELRAGLKQ